MRLIFALTLEFCDPDGFPLTIDNGSIHSFLRVVFEISGIGSIPVYWDKVDWASTALLDEILEPVETHLEARVWTYSSSICDSRRSEFDVAIGEGFHVGIVCGDGGTNVHVRLGFHVGFVERHQVVRSRAAGSAICVTSPGVFVDAIAEAHGYELVLGWETVGFGSPIVGPGDLAVAIEYVEIRRGVVVC